MKEQKDLITNEEKKLMYIADDLFFVMKELGKKDFEAAIVYLDKLSVNMESLKKDLKKDL